jgi:hypothetical protein
MIRYGGSPHKPRDRAFGGTCAPKSEHWRAKMLLAAVITLCLAMLLAGCGGSFRGNASAGPNPGGGFYGAPNIDIGRINP